MLPKTDLQRNDSTFDWTMDFNLVTSHWFLHTVLFTMLQFLILLFFPKADPESLQTFEGEANHLPSHSLESGGEDKLPAGTETTFVVAVKGST